MSTVIITYEAKCKHCIYFSTNSISKRDGSISKIKKHICTNNKSDFYNEPLTLKSKACNKIKL